MLVVQVEGEHFTEEHAASSTQQPRQAKGAVATPEEGAGACGTCIVCVRVCICVCRGSGAGTSSFEFKNGVHVSDSLCVHACVCVYICVCERDISIAHFPSLRMEKPNMYPRTFQKNRT